MTPGVVGRRQLKHRGSSKRNGPNRPVPASPVTIVNVVKTAAVMTISFNQPVSLKGIPAWTTNIAGVTAILASLTTPTILSLTFSASVATATGLIIPFEEPAIRSASGGYVNPGTFPV